MTMKIADVAPNEAQLVELSEQLSEAFAQPQPKLSLDLDASFLEAARTMLASLTEQRQEGFHGAVALTRQEIETYLDLDPDFLDPAKEMLRDFIERTEH
jgi:hypothetical protein